MANMENYESDAESAHSMDSLEAQPDVTNETNYHNVPQTTDDHEVGPLWSPVQTRAARRKRNHKDITNDFVINNMTGPSTSNAPTANQTAAPTTNTNTQTASPQNTDIAAKRKPPPIIVTTTDYFDLFPLIRQACNHSPDYTCKSLGRNKYSLAFTDSDARRITIEAFKAKSIDFHTFSEERNNVLKVVIRKLPINTNTDLLAKELAELGYPVCDVYQMKKTLRDGSSTKVPMPLFEVTLKDTDKSRSILTETIYLFRLRVAVEPHISEKEPQICQRCQAYFHTKTYCDRTQKCYKCTGNHDGADCTITDKTMFKCANCFKAHKTSYKGCPAFKAAKRQMKQQSDKQQHQNNIQSEQRFRPANPPLTPAWGRANRYAILADKEKETQIEQVHHPNRETLSKQLYVSENIGTHSAVTTTLQSQVQIIELPNNCEEEANRNLNTTRAPPQKERNTKKPQTKYAQPRANQRSNELSHQPNPNTRGSNNEQMINSRIQSESQNEFPQLNTQQRHNNTTRQQYQPAPAGTNVHESRLTTSTEQQAIFTPKELIPILQTILQAVAPLATLLEKLTNNHNG